MSKLAAVKVKKKKVVSDSGGLVAGDGHIKMEITSPLPPKVKK